jgi:hypothetical protein
MRDTSLKAYREEALPKMVHSHAAVLGALERLGEATNSEIARDLEWSINRVTGRTNELVKSGKVVDAGKRACKVTGRTAHIWAVKPDREHIPATELSLCCGAPLIGTMCTGCTDREDIP